jgi:heme exporter protein D
VSVELPAHAAFIIAAYLATILVVIGLIAWVLADYRAQQRDLADLEARGRGRKSAADLRSKP